MKRWKISPSGGVIESVLAAAKKTIREAPEAVSGPIASRAGESVCPPVLPTRMMPNSSSFQQNRKPNSLHNRSVSVLFAVLTASVAAQEFGCGVALTKELGEDA